MFYFSLLFFESIIINRVGTKIVVKIHEYNPDNKKLTLTMKFTSQDVSVLKDIPHDKYIQGVVQKVMNFGLIVRPAGYDVTG
jgi:ribosomal protein S1